MPRAEDDQILVIRCGWCGDSIPTVRISSWYDAVDHGLDQHRLQLLAAPEDARRFLRIVNPVSGRQIRTVKKLGST